MKLAVVQHRHRETTLLEGGGVHGDPPIRLGWTRGPNAGEWADDGFAGYSRAYLERLAAEAEEWLGPDPNRRRPRRARRVRDADVAEALLRAAWERRRGAP